MKASESPSDRLLKLIEPYSSVKNTLSAEDIAKVPWSRELESAVLGCLKSKDKADLVWGLFFSEGILRKGAGELLLAELRRMLPSFIKHQEAAVREMALPLLITLRESYTDYRATMLECLSDTNSEVRMHALAAFQTFLNREDIPLLLDFQNDDYMSETEMNSPLVYPIRNQALAVIGALCQKRFPKAEKVKMVEDGQMVYWWDWKPFLDWWRKRQSKWRFWERR